MHVCDLSPVQALHLALSAALLLHGQRQVTGSS